MSTRERSTSTASEGAAAPPPPAPPGRFQLKEAKEALTASKKREADLKRSNEELRAKVESFHGLRALTEATEETNANLRAEAQDQARRCREDREALDITKGALEKARADCARTIADLATAHQKLREAERLKKDAEAQTRRALDEAARSAQKQQDTAARLSHVGRERDLAAEALRVSERDQASSEETIESLETKLQDAEARAQQAEDAASDARDRAWRHHRSAAETKSLAVDVRRLVKLLASTEEYRRFGALWRDGGGDWETERGMSYVGPEASAPFDEAASLAPPPTQEDWAAFAELEAQTTHSPDVLLNAKEEPALWAPTEALKNAIEFHQDKIPHVPFDCIREFLHKMNGAWLDREQRHCDRLEAQYRRRLDEFQRVTQHGIPYEKIAADKEIAKLKAELKKCRRSRLKGRPSSRVERSSVKSMRFQARDELLAASLSAMETMSLASGSPSKRRTSTSSKGTPSPLTMRSASRSSRRGSYE